MGDFRMYSKIIEIPEIIPDFVKYEPVFKCKLSTNEKFEINEHNKIQNA